MDATIKGKISFLGNQNQLLANSSGDAPNYFNSIIHLNFSNKFWQKVGLAGASALITKAAIPKVTISAIPDMIATTSTELATTSGATSLATSTAATGTLALPATTSTALATSSSVAGAGGAIIDGSFVAGDVLAAGAAEAMPGITYASSTAAAAGSTVSETAAVGASAAAGGSAIAAALPYVVAGIAIYVTASSLGNLASELMLARKGEAKLRGLSNNVISLKTYCNIMRSQISVAVGALSSASKYVSIAENRIINNEYKSKNQNLKNIRERQAEISSLIGYLNTTKKVLDVVYKNLAIIA